MGFANYEHFEEKKEGGCKEPSTRCLYTVQGEFICTVNGVAKKDVTGFGEDNYPKIPSIKEKYTNIQEQFIRDGVRV